MKMFGLSSMGACPAAGECMQILSSVNILVCNKTFFHAVAFLPEGRESLSLSLTLQEIHVSEASALVSRH